MQITLRCAHENQFKNFRFPCTEKELQFLCDSLSLPNAADTSIGIQTLYDDPLAQLLNNVTVNLNELNYLMKRLDSFDVGEMNTFYAVASGQKLSGLKDMINLTFNTHCYSLVDDFSDLDRLGKNLYLSRMVSVATKELDELDGKAYVKK